MTAETTEKLLTLLREIREAAQHINGVTLLDDEVAGAIFFTASDAINLVESSQ